MAADVYLNGTSLGVDADGYYSGYGGTDAQNGAIFFADVAMNGSSDYLEFYVKIQSGGAAKNIQAAVWVRSV